MHIKNLKLKSHHHLHLFQRKYLGVYLKKTLNVENYNMLMREIKDDPNRHTGFMDWKTQS